MTAARRSALDRDLAMRLAEEEYRRVADALAELEDDDWTRPTACTAWDVRQLGCHIVGMAAMGATPAETVRQNVKAVRIAKQRGIDPLDALTGLQVSERADWSPREVVAGARRVAPRASRGRRRTPRVVRDRRLPQQQLVDGGREAWTIGYLVDTILTRDPWMHRSDLAVATGRPMRLTAEHDGVIVSDVVAEWSGRHGRPFSLTLTGPAGGTWQQGDGGPHLELDAVEFARIVSGRGAGPGLLQHHVPF